GEVDRIAKAVPDQLGIKLSEALETSPELKGFYEGDPQVHKLVDLARQVEGVARNASTHAAGVVISREPLTDLMPLQRATNSDALMTQYEMHGVEALGLLKFDFLGLSNLTILRQAVELVAEHRGLTIDLETIPLDDAKTFELLASGETTGVFQLESAGMRRYIRDLRPSSVHDLAAMVALYRPGPMDNIPAYIRRKHGEEPVTYLHPLLEPYLEQTYGIFVYQEDIMSAARALGGFTGPEADTLGYAIRKKKSSVLRAQKEKFVTQAAERGVEPAVIDAVFRAFEPFERYGFNKAHATCYGLIAYQTAYLKANYTVEYMASVLTAFRDTTEKVAAAIAECRRLGIAVEPPDIHASGLHFTVEGDAIRFGLLAVKNVGQGAIESLIAAREAGGPFRSLTDFCTRVDLRLVNRRVLESLVKVGAFAAFGHPAQLLDALDDALGAGQAAQRDRITGQTSLFDLGASAEVLERPLPVRSEIPSRERLRWEKELLGLYLSAHPLGDVADRIGEFVTAYAGDLGAELDQQRVVIGGVITGMRTVITKARATMGVASLEDLQGAFEVIVFPKVLEQTGPSWQDGAIVLVAGRVDHKTEGAVVLADAVWTWDEVEAMGPQTFREAVAAGERGRGRGVGNRIGNGQRGKPPPRPVGPGRDAAAPGVPVAVGPGQTAEPARRTAPEDTTADASPERILPWVSPLRAGGVRGRIAWRLGQPARVIRNDPAPPQAPAVEPPEPAALEAISPELDEPALPAEAVAAAVAASQAGTEPLAALPGQALHVRFEGAGSDVLVAAARTLRELVHDHPGETAIVLHVPAPGGAREMLLQPRVAYDAELMADVRRRLGERLVRIELA
ncbi:MAG: DNA polymerase III subunit alpha, partial [Chloroflexota bacterium]